MSQIIKITIPDKKPWTDLKAMVKEKHGKLHGVLGEEFNKLLELGLMITGNPDYQDREDLDQIIDTYLENAHTQAPVPKNMSIKNKEEFTEILPGDCKSKKDRSIAILQYLMKCFEYEFTLSDFKKAQVQLFGQPDYRTVKSNIELLINDNCISKIEMRNIGKKNQSKQGYEFTENLLFRKYHDPYALKEFAKFFLETNGGQAQITLDHNIRAIVIEKEGIDDYLFSKTRADYLVKENIISEYSRAKNGDIIYDVLVE